MSDGEEAVRDPYVGLVLEDKYRVVRKLGAGGMGAVYEGERTVIGRKVAIKVLHAEYAANGKVVARFINEAKAANKIRHSNIIEVFDFGRLPDGGVFLVLEFLEGRDLSELVESVGPLPLGRAVGIALQVCDALIQTHAAGIVHRDLKPENIFLIERDGKPDFVKVLDFGISKFKEEEELDGLTKTGEAIGTPYYMAPEQLRGSKDVDLRTDVYSLGVVLYNVLTGRFPFEGNTFPDLMVKVMVEPPTPITEYRTDLPEAMVALIHRMLTRSPSERPADCGAVRDALFPFREVASAPAIVPRAPHSETPEAFAATMDSSGDNLPLDSASVGSGLGDSDARDSSAHGSGSVRVAADLAPATRGRGLLPLAALLVLGVGAAGVWAATRDSGQRGSTEPDPGVVAVESPEQNAPTVRVRIEASPPEALLTLDGRAIANPSANDFERSDELHVVVAELPDGTRRTVHEPFDRDRTIRIELGRGAETPIDEGSMNVAHTSMGTSRMNLGSTNAPSEPAMVEMTETAMTETMAETPMSEAMSETAMTEVGMALTGTQNTGTMSAWK